MKIKFICHLADPFKDLKWSNVSGVKLSLLSESDDTFPRFLGLSLVLDFGIKDLQEDVVKARSFSLWLFQMIFKLTYQYADAQSMFIAIKARFRGNDATKKTQKALLKQQYENFNATSSESLDSIFNRLQKLV
ncbi:hypothetical protein Tco_0580215 [Tanacetum coccineum]